MEANRKLVGALKTKVAFSHIDYHKLDSLCRNPIFADILARLWFSDEDAEGY
ncbi:hypothetical protein B0H21DRAFT_823522 [Amylocystis lapponica]|nr:hypothetical protein B0H21DRAFT_823522 [Amylocystis lapponica]